MTLLFCFLFSETPFREAFLQAPPVPNTSRGCCFRTSPSKIQDCLGLAAKILDFLAPASKIHGFPGSGLKNPGFLRPKRSHGPQLKPHRPCAHFPYYVRRDYSLKLCIYYGKIDWPILRRHAGINSPEWSHRRQDKPRHAFRMTLVVQGNKLPQKILLEYALQGPRTKRGLEGH